MTDVRKTPEFYPAENAWLISAGVIAILAGLVLLISPFFIEVKGSLGFLDSLRCLAIIIIDLIVFSAGIKLFSLGYSNEKKKRQWLKAAATTSAKIVECKKEDVWDQNYMDTINYILEIMMDISQATGNPNSISVRVYMSESQYKKYSNRKSVKVYYSKEDPFIFVLEDEV